jgi:hypothetical protein
MVRLVIDPDLEERVRWIFTLSVASRFVKDNVRIDRATSKIHCKDLACTIAITPAELYVPETREIEEAIASNARGTRVLAAACASSLCRVEVDHDTAEAQRGLGEALAEVEPFRAGVFYRYDEAAVPPTTTIYVVRDGHDFRDGSGSP